MSYDKELICKRERICKVEKIGDNFILYHFINDIVAIKCKGEGFVLKNKNRKIKKGEILINKNENDELSINKKENDELSINKNENDELLINKNENDELLINKNENDQCLRLEFDSEIVEINEDEKCDYFIIVKKINKALN